MSEQKALSHTDPKNSGIGIASFVISMAAGILTLVVFGIGGVIEASTPGGIGKESVEAIMIGFGLIGLLIANFVALGLGIGGLFQKERKKIFAILGTVFSSAVIVVTVVTGIFGIAIG